MKIGVVNYNAGNLGSLLSALRALDLNFTIVSKPTDVQDCESIIIPGVGAFGYGMDYLEKYNLIESITEHYKAGKQLVGICLGMHLLATLGMEGSPRKGLNLIPGTVRKLESLGVEKVPHLGWDVVDTSKSTEVDGRQFYFAHSYFFDIDSNLQNHVSGTFRWGNQMIPAVIEFENCTALQFHPEKSGNAGLNLLSKMFQKIERLSYEF